MKIIANDLSKNLNFEGILVCFIYFKLSSIGKCRHYDSQYIKHKFKVFLLNQHL